MANGLHVSRCSHCLAQIHFYKILYKLEHSYIDRGVRITVPVLEIRKWGHNEIEHLAQSPLLVGGEAGLAVRVTEGSHSCPPVRRSQHSAQVAEATLPWPRGQLSAPPRPQLRRHLGDSYCSPSPSPFPAPDFESLVLRFSPLAQHIYLSSDFALMLSLHVATWLHGECT